MGMRHRVAGYGQPQVADGGVESGVQDALFGDLPAQDGVVHP
jgi:hypothetical protein